MDKALNNANTDTNQRQADKEQQKRIITDHSNNLTGPTHGSSEQLTNHLDEDRDGETSSFSSPATLLSQ